VAARVAIIGCGAIAESFFLPVLAKRPDLCSGLWLVDSGATRLEAMGKTFGVKNLTTSLDTVMDKIDAAIICTPHDTHYPLSLSLITAGKHVLCEKPLTTQVCDARRLVAAADRAQVVLMTSYGRRIGPGFREIKRIVASRQLGTPVAATWTEGKKFNWPTASGFYFKQKFGIMLDMGPHVIDLLCWWFDTEPSIVECRTDSWGGPEARATVRLDFAGIPAQVDLSYYHKMVNTYSIEFEQGSITGKTEEHHRFVLYQHGKRPKPFDCRMADPATRMLTNFIDAIAGKHPPEISGRDVLPSIKALADAYQCAQRYEEPWLPRVEQFA
jgi:predicted dehydrogenase